MKKKLMLSLLVSVNLFCQIKSQTNTNPTGAVLIDDFESAEITYKKWSNPMESGSLRSSIDISDSAHSEKKGAKISFTGTKSPGGWTNLQCKTSIPIHKNKITFWAKAAEVCVVKITLHQGADHNEMEVFGKNVTIGPFWQKHEFSIDEFTEVIFSHFIQDGGKASANITKSKATAIGFVDTGTPAVFYIDTLMFE